PITPGSGDIVEITPDLSGVPAGVTVSIALDGTVSIDVPAGYTDPTSFTISYEVTDENGLSDSGIITVSVNVNGAPTASDVSFAVTPGTPFVGTLPITPGSGDIVEITPDLSGVPAGVTVTIDLDGTVSIDVPAGYTGPTSFTIPYEVTDENGLSDSGIITVSVNQSSTVDDVSFTVTPGTPFVGTLPITPGSGDIVEITPDLSGVPAGVTVTIDLDGTVNISVPVDYSGPTSFAIPYEVTDENGLSDSGIITVTVNTVSGEKETIISVTKWSDTRTVEIGGMIDYIIRIKNLGDTIAYNLIVVDSLPEGTMAVDANLDGEILDLKVIWEIDSLTVGDSLDIKLKLIVLSEKGPIINSVYVFGSNLKQELSFESEEVVILAPLSPVDLQISKDVSSSIVRLGDEFEYKITVRNNSDFDAFEVIVRDTLPDGVTFIRMSQGQGAISYEESNRLLSWAVDSMKPNSMESFSLLFRADKEGEITNTAYVESSNPEVDMSNNSSSARHSQLEFEVPNVFTPNGDGINDFWIIEGLNEIFPTNQLLIVNRWGVEVFKATNYQNNWNGSNLNGGTYFYQLKIRDFEGTEKTLTGYVTIIK
ncbi:T9SS type B sorting domain-containing protein, partial [Algoriphagus pacificus]